MNGYVCFYRGKRIEIHADTSYEAQCKAAKQLKVKPSKQHEISVVLAETSGLNGPEAVIHVAVD